MVCLFAIAPSFAQSHRSEISAPNTAIQIADTTRRYGIGIQFGTTGLGLQVARKLPTRARLTARLGASYFAYRKLQRLDIGEGSMVNVQPDLMMGMGQASLKWHPFKRSSFFLTAGAAYAPQPSLTATLSAEDKLTFGGLEMSAEDFGTNRLSVQWKNLLGYAGLGMGRSVPKRRIGFAFELGCYYLGKPDVRFDYDGFLETTTIDQEVKKIENNLSGYRFLPSLQFLVSYAIR